jgi:rubrerythrin
MQANTSIRQERAGRAAGAPRVITGPFPGYDRYGRLDHYYYRCACCGLEAVGSTMRRGCPRCGVHDAHR